jgi:hypothetical protein
MSTAEQKCKARNAERRKIAGTTAEPSTREILASIKDSADRIELAVIENAKLNARIHTGRINRDDAPHDPDAGAYPMPRIMEVPQDSKNKGSGQSAPVSVLIDDVHSRTSGLHSRLEFLRDSLVHGIHPDSPRPTEAIAAGQPSQGPSKDALNWAFSNLAASEALVEEIQRYLLNN